MYGKRLIGVATLATGVVISLAPAPALADDSGSVSSGPIPQSASTGTYWTAARMASAKPVPIKIAGRAKTSSTDLTETATGSPAVEEPSAVAGTDSGADVPMPLAAGAVPKPYTNYPDRLNGKVFFTQAGQRFVCSGTAVNSANKSIVWTAGHCVHGGRGGRFHTNWAFVPAYSSSFNGHRPYGTWTARELWTRTQWATNSNFRQDLGAVVVNRINNVRLVDKIGGQGIAFNFARNQAFSSFGYPQAAPFNGFLQFRCNSGRLADDFPPGVGPATIKISCNMTAGCSGGGWMIRLGSNGLGYLNGLNSYRYSNTPNNLFGPYFGNEALSLYNAVKARPA